MCQRDDMSNQKCENLGIKLITLGAMITKIGDGISSIASTFSLNEINDEKNQQHLEELERNLQILIDEINDYTKEVLAQIS
ncbi:hypothetical protein [Sporosarcina psychrophila]|uniref:hypothetical protein n=1 Tax=Sporosarcina psychrophila TaxID=1476 RepID=UPI00078E3F8A|nr:hypothetical protein [Sporosarcina psychrophila]AMQ06757.1 hypothetical protein AZE41_12890 [Sporosarcina psychrophila]